MTDKNTTMKEPIQRYSQGFGGFGMLEKCNDGKLVKYADHENEIIRIDDYKNGWKNRAILSERDSFEKDDEIFELKCRVINLKLGLFISSFIAATLLAIIVFVK